MQRYDFAENLNPGLSSLIEEKVSRISSLGTTPFGHLKGLEEGFLEGANAKQPSDIEYSNKKEYYIPCP